MRKTESSALENIKKYRLFLNNTKQILKMKENAMSRLQLHQYNLPEFLLERKSVFSHLVRTRNIIHTVCAYVYKGFMSIPVYDF